MYFWSQYIDSANLEYTAKSTSTSLWPTIPVENTSPGFQGTVFSVHPLSHNSLPWISWSSNQVSSCNWNTMLLEAHCYHQLTSLEKSPMCPFSSDSEFHHPLPWSILPCFHLIRPTYTLEYQDHGFETLEHNILSYETFMDYPYKLMHTTKPVTTGYHPYLHWY